MKNLGVGPWPTAPMGHALETCGGVVIRRRDLKHLAELPGVITDFDLQRVGQASLLNDGEY